MKMMHNKQLQQLVDDHLDNIRSVKGETFADMVSLMMECTQVMRMVHVSAQMISDKEPEFAKHMTTTLAETFSAASSMLAHYLKFSDDETDEMMRWVKILNDHYEKALAEANK